MEEIQTIRVRPYLLKELAGIYGVDPRTLKNWLIPFKTDLGFKTGKYYTARQVAAIFEKIGFPYSMAA